MVNFSKIDSFLKLFKGKALIVYYIMENQQLRQREQKAIYMMKYNPKYREAHQEAIQATRAV